MNKGVILNNNFLNEVIFRIDYGTIPELTGEEKDNINKFKKLIPNSFKLINILQQKNLNVQIDSDTPINSVDKGNLRWIFHNKENNKEISLSANNLIISYRKESCVKFKDFLTEINMLISALKEYGDIDLEFLGLRYINEIDDFEINSNVQAYINPTLFNKKLLDDLKTDNGELIQIFSKLDFQQEEYNLTLQYGFYNPTFDPKYDKHFVLDFDCIYKKINNIDEVIAHLKTMNELIWKKFEYAITENFVTRVGETYESSR